MAYLRPLVRHKCSYAYCGKYATCQVIDRWNGERGVFCATHGRAAMREQARAEAGNDGKVR